MTSWKNNQVSIQPRIHSEYQMKNVHFHFTFPSKHVVVTNYSHICNFIQLYQHCSHISDYTFTTKMTCRTNRTVVVKVVDLDTNCIFNPNYMVSWTRFLLMKPRGTKLGDLTQARLTTQLPQKGYPPILPQELI